MPTPLRCDPSLLAKDLTGQVIIVTGASSGCGLETVRQLVKQGATVILACRSQERGQVAAKEVGGGGKFLATLDLASLDSVKAFVDIFLSKYDRLDALVNNAGIMACPYAKTQDGFEIQFGSNHLGHFYLMRLLTPLPIKTAETTGKPSRFIALSSSFASAKGGIGQLDYAKIHFDDLMWENTKYHEVEAYQQSKLANYLHVMEAAQQYPADQLISVAVHPGWVQTNLDVQLFQKFLGDGFLCQTIAKIIRKLVSWKGALIQAVDGSQTTLYCVLEDADKMQSGAFYS